MKEKKKKKGKKKPKTPSWLTASIQLIPRMSQSPSPFSLYCTHRLFLKDTKHGPACSGIFVIAVPLSLNSHFPDTCMACTLWC